MVPRTFGLARMTRPIRAPIMLPIYSARGRRLGRQRAEDEAGELVGAQFPKAMFLEAEAVGHAALAADAAAERDALQIAGEVVIPRMIDAGQAVRGVALALQADEIAAMGAAVEHRMDLAVLAAGDDDRGLAEKGRLVVAGLGQLVGEREVLPARAEKDAVELGLVDVGVGKHPVRDPRIALLRPGERVLIHGAASP